MYGTTLRLPGELLNNHRSYECVDASSYVSRLQQYMNQLKPTPPRPTFRQNQLLADLDKCPYVFVRVDAVKKPLQPPYDGPFKVISRRSKYFVLNRHGASDSVSIDRVKPLVEPTHHLPSDPPHIPDSTLSAQTMCSSSSPPAVIPQTKSGRTVRWPTHLADFC